MRLFRKVAIVGTGLIGGSLALAIKKNKMAESVVGVSRHQKSLALAGKMGAIGQGSRNLDIIRGADLVILATPVNTIIKLAPKISRFINKECIVTDVGSTKEQVSKILGKLFPRYVGSHPLAGSEKRSILNARSGIFKDSLCIITPTKNTDKAALNKINLLWRKAGAKVLVMSPQRHDRILSLTSHLPHILAFSLIGTVPREFLRFSSGGLKDTTRIAASDSEIWSDIFLSNAKNISSGIDAFLAGVSRIQSAIRKNDARSLSRILRKAKKQREKLG